MKKLPLILSLFVLGVALMSAVSRTDHDADREPTFDDAIALIKKYEGISSARHWPFVGYGHKVMRGEKFKRGKVLTESEAEELARKDYAKLCALYREFGADSLLLGALAYNCGPGVVAKSSVLAKLKAGDRDIESAYIAHSKYRGKQLSQLKRRRQEELATLFVKNLPAQESTPVGSLRHKPEHIKHTSLSLEHEPADSVASGHNESHEGHSATH